jgi:hypothetical protein
MSSPISTPDALSSETRPYRGLAWRLVEAQNQISTLKLVDTLEEQALLEELIDATKPAFPPDCRGLDYLLATPFRYGAPYPQGSRFRRAGLTEGVFYASEEPRVALAELAFRRLLFFAESPNTPWPTDAAEYTAFSVRLATPVCVDLTAPPLNARRAVWTDPLDYAPCQALADAARTAGAALVRYESARDPARGANLAVLRASAFARERPVERRAWRMRLGAAGVQALCEFPRERIEFDRRAFARDARFVDFAWER